MIYKLGTVKDMSKLPYTDSMVLRLIQKDLTILDVNYGSDRDIDNDYGGYILFAPKGTNTEEIKSYFDYESNLIEYVERYKPNLCAAVYITSTEYGVVLIISLDDAPAKMV